MLDTKPDPRQPQVVRTIKADELAAKPGYSRPHTVHPVPCGIFMSNLGGANGSDGPGGVALIDHDLSHPARRGRAGLPGRSSEGSEPC